MNQFHRRIANNFSNKLVRDAYIDYFKIAYKINILRLDTSNLWKSHRDREVGANRHRRGHINRHNQRAISHGINKFNCIGHDSAWLTGCAGTEQTIHHNFGIRSAFCDMFPVAGIFQTLERHPCFLHQFKMGKRIAFKLLPRTSQPTFDRPVVFIEHAGSDKGVAPIVPASCNKEYGRVGQLMVPRQGSNGLGEPFTGGEHEFFTGDAVRDGTAIEFLHLLWGD